MVSFPHRVPHRIGIAVDGVRRADRAYVLRRGSDEVVAAHRAVRIRLGSDDRYSVAIEGVAAEAAGEHIVAAPPAIHDIHGVAVKSVVAITAVERVGTAKRREGARL